MCVLLMVERSSSVTCVPSTQLHRSLPCVVSMATGPAIDPRSPWVVARSVATRPRPRDRFLINVPLFIDPPPPALETKMQYRSGPA